MSDLTLLVMAAGMGSRYGGLKQLDSVGPMVKQSLIIQFMMPFALVSIRWFSLFGMNSNLILKIR